MKGKPCDQSICCPVNMVLQRAPLSAFVTTLIFHSPSLHPPMLVAEKIENCQYYDISLKNCLSPLEAHLIAKNFATREFSFRGRFGYAFLPPFICSAVNSPRFSRQNLLPCFLVIDGPRAYFVGGCWCLSESNAPASTFSKKWTLGRGEIWVAHKVRIGDHSPQLMFIKAKAKS